MSMSREDKIWGTVLACVIVLCSVMVYFMFLKFKEMKNRIHNTVYTARLSDGKEVVCRGYSTDRCGIQLYRCADGMEYACQTNVTILKRELLKEKS